VFGGVRKRIEVGIEMDTAEAVTVGQEGQAVAGAMETVMEDIAQEMAVVGAEVMEAGVTVGEAALPKEATTTMEWEAKFNITEEKEPSLPGC
jgi:hypothetical protein